MPSAPDPGGRGPGNEHAVVLCTDRGMFLPALSVASDAAAGAAGYDVVLLVDAGGVPAGFARWHEERGAPFQVTEFDFGAWVPEALRPTQRFPRASAFRLLLTRFFAGRYRRLLFLDADLRLCTPLSGLLRLDLGGMALAAASSFDLSPLTPDGEYLTKNLPPHLVALGFPRGRPYLNAGVMLIDVAEWDRQEITARAIDFIVANREACAYFDQDGINAAVAGSYAVLSPGWNRHPIHFQDRRGRYRFETFIFHYYGDSKPWNPHWRGLPEHACHFHRFFAGLWPGALVEGTMWRPPPAPPEPPAPLASRLARQFLPDAVRHRISRAFGRTQADPTARTPHEVDTLIARYLAETPFVDVVQGISPRPWVARRYRRPG